MSEQVPVLSSLPGQRQRVQATWAYLRDALFVTRREVKDTLRDWRLVGPILLLITVFPFLANFAARKGLGFVNQYGAGLIMERLLPFLMLAVGFFPSTFSLVIGLETFVGEKERRSLEPLLATPLTDLQLYIGKLLASTIVPVLASYVGMTFYLLLMGLTVDWWPSLSLFIVSLVVATTQALVMVNAAVVVSTQATSVRAANLVASFIIIPMAFLLQWEAALLLFGQYNVLWLLVVFLAVVNVLLIRIGIQIFDREHLLGREIDYIDLKAGWEAFWGALKPQGGLKGLYLHDIPQILKSLRLELLFVLIVVLGGGIATGYWGAAHFRLPTGVATVPELLGVESFDAAVRSAGLLPRFSAAAVWWNNIRSLGIGAFLSLFSLGTVPAFLLMLPVTIITYAFTQVPALGMDPWGFLATFVLPHGSIELPAAILATAQAVRMGTSFLRSPEAGGGVTGMLRETGYFLKLFLALVLPLLLIAALIEVNVTPQLVLDFLGQMP